MKTLSFNYSCEREALSVRVEVRDLSIQCTIHSGNEIVLLWFTLNHHYSRLLLH